MAERTAWKRRHPNVWNMRDPDTPHGAIYVGRGRGSTHGNPYSHIPGKGEHLVTTRDDAVDSFRTYAVERAAADAEYRAAIIALDGADVACWCAPARCHGEVLLELAATFASEQNRTTT